jgi:NTE family protein
MRMNKKYGFVFFIFLLGIQMMAQEKTALVLSGGGSKALAHIGVIRALEEQNIQIDYVVGSSMGAFVGAMYASGMTPDEMEAYVIGHNIESWVSSEKDASQLYYFMEDDVDASLFSIDFKFW